MMLKTQTTAQNAPGYMSSDIVAQPVSSIHSTGSCSDYSGSRTPPKPGELRMTRSHGAQPRTAAGRRPAAVKKRASSRAVSAGPRFIEMSPGTPTIAQTPPVAPTTAQQFAGVPKHVLVAPTIDTQDAQLAALVQQQKVDHAHFQDIHALLKSLCEHAAYQEVDMQGTKDAAVMMRRELFSVRDGLSSEFKVLNSELERSIGKIRDETAQQTGNKLASLEASVLALQASSAASADCTRRMAMYLEELDGARPQEGNELASGFQRVIGEIHLVRERVKQFEQMSAAAGAADAASPPGIATSQAHAKMLDEIAKKIKTMEETLNLADNSLLAYTSSQAARIDDICAAATVQDGRITLWNNTQRRPWAQLSRCVPSKRGNIQVTPAEYLLHRHIIMEIVEAHSELQEDFQLEEVYEALMDLREAAVEEIRDTLTTVHVPVPKVGLTEPKSATATM